MAVYRPIYTSFWQDDFILSLPYTERYFYLYLMTNSKTTLCGIYELPRSVAVMETGLTLQKIEEMLAKFQNQYHRVVCSKTTKEIIVTNWLKYNNISSGQFQKALDKSFQAVKDRSLIRYAYGIEKERYGIDTVSIYTVSDTDTVPSTDLVSFPVLETEKKDDGEEEEIQFELTKEIIDEIIGKWSEVPNVARIDCIEHKRKQAVEARIKSKGIEKFLQMIENVKVSPFLLGKIKDRDGKAFKASFDWCICPNNFQKILDGNYIQEETEESLEDEIARRIREMGEFTAGGAK